MKVLAGSIIATLLLGCSMRPVELMAPTDATVGDNKMLLVVSVAESELLHPERINIAIGEGDSKRFVGAAGSLDFSVGGDNGVYVFRLPREIITLSSLVLLSDSGKTRWETHGSGPQLVPGKGDVFYAGRLGIEAIRFLPFDDSKERRPAAVRITITDASNEDFPLLTKWQALASRTPATIVPSAWSDQEFVELRIAPDSREEIRHERRLESKFCIPTVEDFDEFCR